MTRPLEIDPADVNDIIDALKSINFDRYIILEDFHYLPDETQRDFASAMKAFHERSSFCFIVVGVWLEENRLTVYNGDLTGRVISINADRWTREEQEEVISSGEHLLNIRFSDTFKNTLLASCFDSVYIIQEVCYQCCEACKITQTATENIEIGADIDVEALITEVVNQQTARFRSFITQFADGFQDTELAMYQWILLPVIEAKTDELEAGLKLNQIRKAIQARHPRGEDLNAGNVTQALRSAASLQVKKNIKPIILDYDQTNLRLNVVDRSFLIWLERQDSKELLEMADLSDVGENPQLNLAI